MEHPVAELARVQIVGRQTPDRLNSCESSYVFLTCDKWRKQKPIEARQLRETGVAALFLGPFWSRLGFRPQAL